MKLTKLILCALTGLGAGGSAWADQPLAQYFNFEGVLTDANNSPVANSTANVEFKIFDPTGTCLLYDETQTSIPTDGQGNFSVQVGSAVGSSKRAANDPGLTWPTIFQNSTAPAVPGSCYHPGSGDGRKMQVTINGTTLSPMVTVGAVPQATVAETLQGLPPSQFLQYNSVPQLTQTNIQNMFSGTGWANLSNVLNGNLATNGNGSTALPALSADPGAGLTPGNVWFNTTTNSVNYYNGTSVVDLSGAGGGGSVTSITAGAGLMSSPTTITTNGTLSLATTGTPGTYTKVTTDSYGRVTTGTNITGNDISSGTIGGATSMNVSGNITTTGIVTAASITSNGASTSLLNIYQNGNNTNKVSITAPSPTTSYSLVLPNAAPPTDNSILTSLASGQMVWASPGQYFSSAGGSITGNTSLTGTLNVSGTSTFQGQISSTLGIDNGGSGIQNTGSLNGVSSITGNNALSIGASGTNQSLTLSGGAGGAVVIPNGNFGIGTTNPTAPLTVQGSGSLATLVNTDPMGSQPLQVLEPNLQSGPSYQVGINIGTQWNTNNNSGNLYFGNLGGYGSTSNYVGLGMWGRPGPDFVVNGLGLVGIGTNAPGANLHVKGQIWSDNSESHFWQGTFTDAHTGTAAAVKISNSVGGYDALDIYGGNVLLMGGGKIGVGTTAPNSLLQVVGGEVQVGTSGTTCITPVAGAIRYNGAGALSFCNGTNWVPLSQAAPTTYLDESGGTMTGSLVGADGTAGAPAFALAGDSGTGFYEDSSHVIGVSNNGVESMKLSSGGITGTGPLTIASGGSNQNLTLSASGTGFVTTNNWVGIGTAVPASPLDVNGVISLQGIPAIALPPDSGGTGSSIAIGPQVLQSQTTPSTNYANTAIGYKSMSMTTTAIDNTALGYEALMRDTTGQSGTAVGYGALVNNTSGNYNTAVGFNALASNGSGASQTAVGYGALQNNSSTGFGTAVGYRALSQASGQSNTALGYMAGYDITTGQNNIAIGSEALGAGSPANSGSNNIVIGLNAGQNNLGSGSGNIIIGANTDTPTVNESNSLNIGNTIFATNMNSTGSVGIGTPTPTYPLTVNGPIQTAGMNGAVVFPDSSKLGTAGHGVKAYTSGGTFVVPPGVFQMKVSVIGAGGGGGSGTLSSAGGYGGAGYAFMTVPPGASITVSIGSAGNGAGASNTAGSAGSNGTGITYNSDTINAGGGGGGNYGSNTPGTPGSFAASGPDISATYGSITMGPGFNQLYGAGMPGAGVATGAASAGTGGTVVFEW